MGNLKAWGQSNPEEIKKIEAQLGLAPDGQWDPDLEGRISAYQQILGQDVGQTADNDGGAQWGALMGIINQRGAAFGPGGDPTPMQDTGFQAFLRNAGAAEADILDEIRERTAQTTREINRTAAGHQAERGDMEAEYSNQETALNEQARIGKQRINKDFSNRGFVGSSAEGYEQGEVDRSAAIDRSHLLQKKGANLGQLDQKFMEGQTQRRDALAAATRTLRGDVLSLYRQRGDEELKARDRIGLKSAQGNYPNG